MWNTRFSIASTDAIMYARWNPDSADIVPLQLHPDSLSVPPPVVINDTVINDLVELYKYYDSQLGSTLDKVDSMISQAEVTTETICTDCLAYASCGLSAMFSVALRYIHSLVRRRLADNSTALFLEPLPRESTKPLVSKPSHSHRVCKRCYKPVKQGHQNTKIQKSVESIVKTTQGPEDRPRWTLNFVESNIKLVWTLKWILGLFSGFGRCLIWKINNIVEIVQMCDYFMVNKRFLIDILRASFPPNYCLSFRENQFSEVLFALKASGFPFLAHSLMLFAQSNLEDDEIFIFNDLMSARSAFDFRSLIEHRLHELQENWSFLFWFVCQKIPLLF